MSQPDFEAAMRTLAADADTPAPLPHPDLVWQRAAARARWRQRELATRPIRLVEWTACIVCAAALMAGLLILLPEIGARLRAIDPFLLRSGAAAFAAVALVALVLVKELLAEE